MAPIIRQNVLPPALPDFRNLGTVLRVLVAVNGFAAVAALVRAPRWDGWLAEWLDLVVVVEPQVLAALAVFQLLQPWLARWSYAAGVAFVVATTLATGAAVHVLFFSRGVVAAGPLARSLALGLVACVALLYYFRLRARALSPAITEARLQALQARIRPHFLFNSINAALSLVRSEPRRAEAALEDMADLFRVLMRDNRELVPLDDEIELCRQYLELERLRLGERLQVEWHLNSMPGDALVPPLMLQPLLENAVYHGIEPSAAPGTVSINIFYKGGVVHAILRNPYRSDGGAHHAGNKMALDNVRERLALHFDSEASLKSKVLAGAYEVHIRIPYRSAKDAPAPATTKIAAVPGGVTASHG